MRIPAALLCLLFLAAPGAHAEEDAPAAPAPEVPTVTGRVPVAVALDEAVAVAAPGTETGSWVFATEAGPVIGWSRAAGVRWRVALGEDRAAEVRVAPGGALLAAATARELVVLATADGAVRWRAKRPVAFAFSADGATVWTVSKQGALAARDAATGAERSTRQAGDRREVALASLHPASGLVVLGVADG